MRKLVSLGLFALIFSLFSSQVLASNAEVCDELKGSAKGLHGLCVAWHNADDKNRDKIAARFEDRAGYPLSEIVGGAFSCPCWAGVVLADIENVTAPQMCILNFPGSGDDLVFFGDETLQQDFATNGVDCGYIADYIAADGSLVEESVFRVGLDSAAGQQCTDEMTEIVNEYFDGGATCRVIP